MYIYLHIFHTALYIIYHHKFDIITIMIFIFPPLPLPWLHAMPPTLADGWPLGSLVGRKMRFCGLPKTIVKMISRNIGKRTKIVDFGFSKPSQIHPKCFQNRCFKKHAIFHGFVLIFGCLLQEPNLKFHAPSQCFVDFSHNSAFRFQHAFSPTLGSEKPTKNPTKTKSEPFKNQC